MYSTVNKKSGTTTTTTASSSFVPQYFEIREVGKTIKMYEQSYLTSLGQRSSMCGGSDWASRTTL